jgi:hypothetical protein
MSTDLTGVICWDFDHTLFGYQAEGRAAGDAPFAGFGARAGIEGTLERLARLGYAHDITTGGSLSYVRCALAAVGAEGRLRHFTHIFPGEVISVGAGKLYRPVAQAHGLADEDALACLIVIGDLADDEPADLASVVFIRQPNGHRQDPRVVEDLIVRLRAAGAGSFHTGFQALHTSARAGRQEIPYGGYLAAVVDDTAICCAERPPGPQRRARLGDVATPTITLLVQGEASGAGARLSMGPDGG